MSLDFSLSSIVAGIIGFVVGVLAAIFSGIGLDQYKRWRDRIESEKQRLKSAYQTLLSLLTNYQIRWIRLKKSTSYDAKSFQQELSQITNNLTNSLSNSADIIKDDVQKEIKVFINASSDMIQQQFYLNGGRSFDEFIRKGNELYRSSNDIAEKIKSLA